MYCIFTYIWVILLGHMLVNIPAPWSIWVWYLANKKASRTEIHCRIQQHLPQRGGNAPWVDFGWELVWDRKLKMLKTCSKHIFHTSPTSKTTAKTSCFFLLHAAALDAACGTSQGTFKVEPIILDWCKHNDFLASNRYLSGWWFQPTPLKHDGVGQLGLWHSQLIGKS